MQQEAQRVVDLKKRKCVFLFSFLFKKKCDPDPHNHPVQWHKHNLSICHHRIIIIFSRYCPDVYEIDEDMVEVLLVLRRFLTVDS